MSLEVQQSKIVSLEFNDQMTQTIKNMYFRDSTDEEFQVFLHVCKRTGLDPTMRQIHPVKRAGKMTIQTGIDGFRLIAERTGKYAPGRESTFVYDAQGKVQSATAYIKKQTNDGSWHEVSATAFYSEYVQMYNGKPSQFWAKMPHTMLSKVAECICLRKAFPADLSGIYSTEEMEQAENPIETECQVVKPVDVKPLDIPDLPQDEVDAYIDQNWSDDKPNFYLFMETIKLRKGWNNRKCLEQFTKEHEHVKKTFGEWVEFKKKKEAK